MHTAILCDIDKTLALIGDRDPYDATNCEWDAVNEPIADILNTYAHAGKDIILITGRHERHREATRNWLKANWIPHDLLLMRPDGDHRPDTVVKEEMYHQQVEWCYRVLFVLEDRSRAVQMWRGLGLTCLQVADGDY